MSDELEVENLLNHCNFMKNPVVGAGKLPKNKYLSN